MRKKIAINTRFLLKDKLEGVGRFSFEILKRMTQNHPEHDFIFLFDRPFSEAFIFGENVKGIVVNPPTRHPFLWYFWFEWAIPNVLKKVKADVFLSMDGYCSLRSKVPQIMVVHDLAFEHYPEQVPFLVQKYYRYFTPKYCQKAAQLIAVSEYTKTDIQQKYGIDSSKIKVVYNAADRSIYQPLAPEKQAEVRTKYAQNCPYFLFVGAIHPRKNLANILQAYDQFRQKNPQTNIKFLVAGRRAWHSKTAFEVYENMAFQTDVIFLGHLNIKDLAAILASAKALVYPSFFEGFGIPILEAFHTHTPVITSDASSMPEVAGGAALLVHPNNVNSILAAMERLHQEPLLAPELVAKGQAQLARFDWGKSARGVWGVIEDRLQFSV